MHSSSKKGRKRTQMCTPEKRRKAKTNQQFIPDIFTKSLQPKKIPRLGENGPVRIFASHEILKGTISTGYGTISRKFFKFCLFFVFFLFFLVFFSSLAIYFFFSFCQKSSKIFLDFLVFGVFFSCL